MNNKLIGVIDIGSNSVRLCLAETSGYSIMPFYNSKITTRLYQNISDTLELNNVSMRRTIDAIIHHKNKAIEQGVFLIYCFATAAMRVASNKDEFMDLVYEKTKLKIDLLSEDQEAQAAFFGVNQKGLCGIIDIGGASTEIAIGEDQKLLVSKSMKMGAVKGKELFYDKSQSTQEVIDWAKKKLEIGGKDIIDKLAKMNKPIWYGVGGTITTMAAIINKMVKYNSDIINNTIINKAFVNSTIKKLTDMTEADRKNVVGLEKKRSDIITFGLCILSSVMEYYGIDELHASDNDNLIGYMRMILKESNEA